MKTLDLFEWDELEFKVTYMDCRCGRPHPTEEKIIIEDLYQAFKVRMEKDND